MIRVKATREGRVGYESSSGWIIDTHRLFVALPDVRAIHKRVRLMNPLNGRNCEAEVLDVGPWNTHDSAYVFGGQRPAAEYGKSLSGHGTNRAGIDLGEAVWNALAMKDNGDIDWEFLPQQ